MAQYHVTGKDMEYEEDLRPNNRAGENRGGERYDTFTAFDMKDLHERLRELPDDVLRQIPVLDVGARLEEGATYFDIIHPERGEFTGMNDQEAGPDECLVNKSDVDFELWNKLIGVTHPERLGRFAENKDQAA